MYSKKSGDLIMTIYEPSAIKLSRGWNFITITPNMIGQTLNEMKGTCDWTGIYAYEKEAGQVQWLDLLNNPNFVDKEDFTRRMVGMGLVIKVSEDCQMGPTEGSIMAPPPIPT